ncbi:MAG TPA: hypothetical protein VLC09_09565 [Polyangiaceae bacterium]|nr:hypothetical protein [Polyangiaceae bacterium]
MRNFPAPTPQHAPLPAQEAADRQLHTSRRPLAARCTRRALFHLAVCASLAALLASTTGCSGCDPTGQQALEYTDGVTSPDRTLYESTLPGEDMLHFPPGRVYELAHGLGTNRIVITPYISFVKRLVPGGDGSDVFAPNHIAPSAGNTAVIEGWDDKHIRIRNDTCAEFYLLVTATTSAAYAGGGGAGGASQP